MSNKRFNEAFLKAVDFAFDSLGKSCKQALYFHLKNSFNVGRNDVSEKVEDFDEALSLIFKDGGGYLKRLVLKKLCEDLGVKFEESYVNDFVGAVSKLNGMVSEDEPLVAVVSGFNDERALVKKRRGGEINIEQGSSHQRANFHDLHSYIRRISRCVFLASL